MTIIKQAGYMLFHILIATYTVLLISTCIVNTVNAQYNRHESSFTEQDHYKIGTLEERMSAMESMKLDQRLIRIEMTLANLDSHQWTNNLADGGIGLLLARALYLAVRKRGLAL